ncbi:MAG: Gfo/Idh/MocA family oxidoreductase [Chloroflexi bacterium]|nr:Gfo/Idh/MocA family oxidoreductase [Chloroflexota bacterium]
MSETRYEPLRVALIGTGFGARVQLPGFLGYSDTLVVALCGAHEQKTKDIAAQYGVKAVYTDYEQMLVDVKPDLVSITTPPKFHNPMTVAAFQAGAHVLCEKPLAMNVAEVQEMLDVAKQTNRVHAVDHEFRYLPPRYYQRVLVDQGFIGEPLLLEATILAPMRLDPQRAWNWWSDAAQGGGVLNALGSHFIDAFRWLSGRNVRAVTASIHTTPQYNRRPLADGSGSAEVTSDDTATLILEMDGGLRGVITISALAGGETQRLAVHGTEGALVVMDDQQLWGRRRGEPLNLIPIPPEYEPPLWVPDENLLLGPFVKLVGLMVDQIRGQALLPLPNFEDGLAIQRVLDAARQSSAEGRRIEIGV